jgi:hypothetical protein
MTHYVGAPPTGRTATGRVFFRHRPPVPGAEEVVLSEATRLMCAGVYVDPEYARRLVTELVEDEHRAVVPSAGFDLNPVLRHCFRSRRIEIIRDTVLTATAAAGLLLTPLATAVWVALGIGILTALALRGRSGKMTTGKVALGFVAGLVLLCLVLPLVWSVAPPADLQRYFAALGLPPPGSASVDPASALARGWLWIAAALLVVAFGTMLWSRLQVYRVLTGDLAAGRRHRLPALAPGRVRRRVDFVSAAQWGNVTLHAHRNPFLGAGSVVRSWSMSLELRHAGNSARVVDIDAVDMHAAVRTRLEQMRSGPIRDREKISGLILRDHIIANGSRGKNDPVLDPGHGIPYAEASREAIEAIIRHPQGSLRYYQRTIVGAEGKDVVSEPDAVVVPAQDQEIVVSTFLYLAIEGGMLYTEFVATVMPPIAQPFHLVDRITPESILGRATGEVLPKLPLSLAAAPLRLIRNIASGGHGRRMDKADRANRDARIYDYGARLSARELASNADAADYMQRLDGVKYYKLVERAVTAGILDYLEAHGVDTSEYRERTQHLHNYGVVITGAATVHGPVAGGAHAQASAG